MLATRVRDLAGVKVSIILPAYNERENVLLLIAEIKNVLADRPKEILVVDNNSPDGTVEAIGGKFPGDAEVRVIRRLKDRGLANSIREGLEKCSGELVVVMDSDFDHPPQYLPFMVSALSHYDCVFGSRFLYGGRMSTRPRHLLSWMFNIFVRYMTGGMITDNLYGFFSIRREALRPCHYDGIFWGFGEYGIRLLHVLQMEGLAILQIPIASGRRKAGSGNTAFVKTFAQYVAATVQLAAQRGRLSRSRLHERRGSRKQ